MIPYYQMTLADVFTETQDIFESDKPEFLKLLESSIDLSELIPISFRNHFYASTGRPREYSKDLRMFFDSLVDLTEPILQEIDPKKASMSVFDTTGLEAYVTENNPKYSNQKIRQLKTWAKTMGLDKSFDPYKAAYGSMPTHASADAEIKQQYVKAYRGLRRVKTDKQDSITIANYGIDNWYRLENHQGSDAVYSELKLLRRQYFHYMELHVKALLELTHMLDYTMPGVKKMFRSWSESNGKDKLSDFVERYWHFYNITAMTKDEFIEDYVSWAAEKKYHQNRSKAAELYDLASDGISTLHSNTLSTKMLVLEAVRVLREIDSTLLKIITRMKELAKTLPEYETVRAMGGVGDVLAPKLIAEIGDIRRFHSGKALIAFAGLKNAQSSRG